jgi:hypothetical protein
MSELVAPTQSEVPEALRAGRAAFARHAWREGCLAGTGRVDRLDGQAASDHFALLSWTWLHLQ